MKPNNVKALNAADASADATSSAIATAFVNWLSVQVITTGTSTGTLKLQFSNDNVFAPNAPTHWTDISGATVAVAAAGSVGIPKIEVCYAYVRAVWTHTNGAAGTVTVNIQTQGAS